MINKVKLILVLIAATFLIFNVSSFAEVTVTSIKGQAKYKTGNQWIALTPGAKLPVGAKVSTGVNANVVLNINGDTVTVKQMSMIRIEENSLSTTESATKIGLKRGGLTARINKIKTLKTSFKIASPVATSSVRGTWEDFSYGPGMGARVQVLEGTIYAENNLGSSNLISGNLEFRQDNSNSAPQDPNLAQLENSRGELLNPYLTQEEQNFLQQLSEIIQTPELNSNTFFLPGAGSGTGNIHVTPVFP